MSIWELTGRDLLRLVRRGHGRIAVAAENELGRRARLGDEFAATALLALADERQL